MDDATRVRRPAGGSLGAMRRVAGAFLSALALAAQEPPRIAVGEWPPYLSAELPGSGLAARITTEAFAREGTRVAFDFYPWARALAMARSSHAAATLLWIRTSDREADFLFSDVVISGTAVFFHLKSRPFAWKTPDDLRDLTLGGLRSASYPWYEKARAEGKALHMNLSTNEADNFRHLLDHSIDAFSIDLLAGVWILRRGFPPAERAQITWHPKPIENWDYCLMVSRTAPGGQALVESFNRGLGKLKADGTWRRMIEGYLVENGE